MIRILGVVMVNDGWNDGLIMVDLVDSGEEEWLMIVKDG